MKISSSMPARRSPVYLSIPFYRSILLTLLATVAAVGCHNRDAIPKVSSPRYDEFVASFYQGLAGLQVGDDVRAESSLSRATELAPGEPASWVDWGILALRQRNFTAAAERLQRAHALAPNDGRIDYLQGLLESERGDSAAAVTDLEQAVRLDPKNLRALYQLASEVERREAPDSDRRFEQLMQQALAVDPNNLAALIDLSRIAAKRGDVDTLRRAVARIGAQAQDWPKEVAEQYSQLQAAAQGPEPRSAATRSIFLRNVLMRVPSFRTDLSVLKPEPGEGAEPMGHFLKMPNPSPRPAAPDLGIQFPAEASRANDETWAWAGAIYLNGDDAPVLAEANAHHVRLDTGATLNFPGAASPSGATPHKETSDLLTPESILQIDFNYDFKTDLVLAGAGGVRFYRQENPGIFTDVTANTKLPQAILSGSYTGAWALDIEADGDLDILLGSASGVPTLLRNNGDGTFTVEHPFSGIEGVRQMTWIDLNADGNPDAAMIDGIGKLHVFLNRRSGSFRQAVLPTLPRVKAIAAGDVGDPDVLDLIALADDGGIFRLFTSDDGASWSTRKIAQVPNAEVGVAGEVRLHAADIDNNGAVDLVVCPLTAAGMDAHAGGAIIWLQDENGSFQQLPAKAGPSQVFDLVDLRNDGRLSLVGLTRGSPAVAGNRGTKNYSWQTIRPRAKVSTGDQRINSFGIGGEIVIRAALLLQKQPIVSPEVHFGLGERKVTDVARILWPNGSVRAEFNLKSDQQIITEQRLKGSCPFLFAWDGREMKFVKDSVPWGSAIGLRINALGSADIAATEEWYKIGRDQLKDLNGKYDLRITGELWETYYYDSMALMTIDHPSGTEIFTDERYDVPPVKLAVTVVDEPQPIQKAIDDHGTDVTSILNKLDGVYLDNFGRGQYQGITRDHYVEVELPDRLPTGAPLWLIAKGWLHPSDSSINVAVSQGSADKPHWLSLEVEGRDGTWRVAKPNLGFPAGRNKICLIDLSGLFAHGARHRLRLRTNLEVYWDSIEWARGIPEAPMHIRRLHPETADLHYRGFSTIRQANASSPEVPDYQDLSGSSQRWRDLEGYYTRYGDVRALLATTDDRYVIMNAGDEMSLQFPVPSPPPPGWVRDFVIAGDGWIKDGDYNSSYSQTVLPYPYHERRNYDSAPGRLEDDWVYRHHEKDWQAYQTRYVTPETFKHALRMRDGQ